MEIKNKYSKTLSCRQCNFKIENMHDRGDKEKEEMQQWVSHAKKTKHTKYKFTTIHITNVTIGKDLIQ